MNITDDHRHFSYARWFYDSNDQRCRRSNFHRENFVYFRWLSHCQRSCPIIHQANPVTLVNLQIWDDPINYKDTVYVQLHVDLSPDWMRKLTDSMNMTTSDYQAQRDYFQSRKESVRIEIMSMVCFCIDYRRRFVNFLDPIHQFMRDHPKETNY